MSKKRSVFSISSWIFWITLGFILLMFLPYLKNSFYSEEKTKEWLRRFEKEETAKSDSLLRKDKKELEKIYWSWKDFEGRNHEISFNISKKEYFNAVSFRENAKFQQLSEFYYGFVHASNSLIDSMAESMRKDLSTKKYTGMDVLNYVVTAIQTPTYTKITDKKECPCEDMGSKWVDDCRPRADGMGCCNNVIPIAAYTPAEFIYKKTGDCDTKALIAYALLKKFGYDAAVILGDVYGVDNRAGKHAMLALANVNPVIPSQNVRYRGRIYYPWEVTSFRDACQLGNMAMWNGWSNWEVICN